MTPKEKEAFDAMRHALEYHIEQTRPIQGSINALAAAKEVQTGPSQNERLMRYADETREEFYKGIKEAIDPTPDPRIAELEAKCADYESALNSIASWNHGPIVGNFFDKPSAANEAREALAKHGGAS